MRLKLTLKSSGIPSRDIAVTVDATATVGDVARYLVQADPRRKPAIVGERATLRAEFPGSAEVRALSPLLSVHESSLRSGCTVEVVAEDAQPSAPARPVASIRVIQGPDEGREFPISAGVNYIGRDAAAQIRLSDNLVSRRHASITVSDSMTITDLNSANGVELDGALVSKASVTGANGCVRASGAVGAAAGVAGDHPRGTGQSGRHPVLGAQ
jgi:S-DNA-T family DNA segregation ATPase FtsK/SpoIIIE